MITTVEPSKVCVYSHRIDGEIIYIGMGVASRPFDKAGRTAAWKALVEKNGSYDVEILGWFDNVQAASQEERKQIMLHQPIANTVYKTRPKRKPNRRKSAVIAMRINGEDKKMIQNMADDAEMPLGDFIMARVWGEVAESPNRAPDHGEIRDNAPAVTVADIKARLGMKTAADLLNGDSAELQKSRPPRGAFVFQKCRVVRSIEGRDDAGIMQNANGYLWAVINRHGEPCESIEDGLRILSDAGIY